MEGRKGLYEFVFVPKVHKMAFIRKGTLDENVKKKGIPPLMASMLIKLCQIFFLGLIIKDIFDKWTRNLILSNSQRTWLPA